jgi:hypothetical protein
MVITVSREKLCEVGNIGPADCWIFQPSLNVRLRVVSISRLMGRGSLMRSFLDELFVAMAVATGAIYHLALLVVLARILA